MQIKQRLLKDPVTPWANVSPLIQRLYEARGIDETQANIALSELLPFHQLLNIDKASARLQQAVTKQERLLIIGDFDADGATASALAVSALKTFGAKNVNFLVPNRFAFGYGLTVGIVEQAYLLKPDLIITVDNGIANIDGVVRAKELGMDVLITDHHLAGTCLPPADAIVNPNQPGCPFPSKAIAGVGVIFYVMSALRRALEQDKWFANQQIPVPNMAQFLDLVALGTIADVVALDKNNRIMVKSGLQRIQKGLARPGIMALIEVSGRTSARLKASDLGFSLGPRLNAAGRLDDMSLGIACLLSENLTEARVMAQSLDGLNAERRQIEAQMQTQALESLQKIDEKNSHLPAICLFDSSWHQGVIGILAGRLKDKFSKPTIIFAAGEHGELKGSARSVQGINIRDILAHIDVLHPGLMIKFGGHAMAAGLAIQHQDFLKFSNAFNQGIADLNHEPEHCLWTDGNLEDAAFNITTAQLIQASGPWGQQFPEPMFDNVFKLVEQRIVGQNHLKLLLQPLSGQGFIDAIVFGIDTESWPNHRARFIRIVHQLDVNEYQGRQKLQLLVKWMEVVDEKNLLENKTATHV